MTAVALGGLAACRGPAPGWQPLWRDSWSWHHRGWEWVRGLEASDLTLNVKRGRSQLRADACNMGEAPAVLRLVDPGGAERQWRLEPGDRRELDVELAAGDHRLSASGPVVLGEPRLGRPPARPRLLVFILVDTLRADHVNRSLTPGLMAAFDRGRRWRQATANCSWTLPSVASLFTARPVLDLSTAAGDLIGIPEGVTTWASRLAEAGFVGGAVVANPTVHPQNGFGAGFSSYLVPDTGVAKPYPDAEWVADEARRWLAAHRGENGFLYLHLMDPHQPYRSHADPSVVAPDIAPLANRQREATRAEAALLARLYAEEVTHVDQALTPLLAALPENALVVLVADHGEALGEHGAWGHGLNLYQEALHVPLAIRGPGVEPGEVDRPVQLLDLAPTLLELMGVAPAPQMVGRSLLTGGSDQPLVSVTFGGGPLRWAWRAGNDKVVLRMAAQDGIGARTGFTFVEGTPLPPGAFHFDLAADPGEQRPGELPPELVARVGGAFATTAGRLVPGLQLLAWAHRGSVTVGLELAGEVRTVQAWSTRPMTVTREGRRVAAHCEEGFPLCGLALAVDSSSGQGVPPADGGEWRPVGGGSPVTPQELAAPPPELEPGSWLWWNPARARVTTGQEETIERLRALGYIK